jgi:hypothetical protein
MNYGEHLAYWYLRLNGFFPLTNFVIHKSAQVQHTSDCDVLAVRPPHVFEPIGGQQDDWDPALRAALNFDATLAVMCEVKTGDYDPKKVFRTEQVRYSLGRLGVVPENEVDRVCKQLSHSAVTECEGVSLAKIFFGQDRLRNGTAISISIAEAEDFIRRRIAKYPKEKYVDRMMFGSDLLQYLIYSEAR